MAKSLLSLFKEGQTELDFSDSEQARAYIDLFGGEEYVKSKYPLFYQAWQRTREYASERSDRIKNEIPKYDCLLDTIHAVTNQKADFGENSSPTRLVSEANFMGVPPVPVFMQGRWRMRQNVHCLMHSVRFLHSRILIRMTA